MKRVQWVSGHWRGNRWCPGHHSTSKMFDRPLVWCAFKDGSGGYWRRLPSAKDRRESASRAGRVSAERHPDRVTVDTEQARINGKKGAEIRWGTQKQRRS